MFVILIVFMSVYFICYYYYTIIVDTPAIRMYRFVPSNHISPLAGVAGATPAGMVIDGCPAAPGDNCNCAEAIANVENILNVPPFLPMLTIEALVSNI
jgi:hypothetical protein